MAAQFLPILLLGPYGGLLADRMDKRRLLMATQAVLGATALALGVLVVTGLVELWMVVVVAVLFGLVTACDNPTRQAFSLEMVGPEQLRNAVSLHSTLVNVARAVGPAVAGIIIATAGTGICFLINAASYAAVLVALWTMETGALRPTPLAVREPGQVREGLRYVGRTPGLLVPLIMLALIGTLAYEFQVVLPLLATGPFGGDAATYGVLTSAMGAGAIVGGLVVAGHGRTGLRPLTVAAAVFGVAILAVALSPTLPVAVVALAATGAASITFLATGNTTLQLDQRAALPRPGDGALDRRVPRQHADRRADRGGHLRAHGPARRPGRGRRDVLGGRRRRRARAGPRGAARGRRPPAPRGRPALLSAYAPASGAKRSCSTTRRSYDCSISGLESRKSAVARLQAMGVLCTTVTRSRALTLTSWGCASSGSQKKITRSMRPSAMAAPTCWSPPRGPLRKRVTGRPSSLAMSPPVVPVANSSCRRQRPAVEAGPLEHVVLAVVVRDQRDALARGHADAVDPHRLLGPAQDPRVRIGGRHSAGPPRGVPDRR